jgi:hypothetical protein
VAISDVIPLFGPGKLEIPASDLSGSNSKYRIELIRDLKEMSHEILKALFADLKQAIGADKAFFCHFIEMIDVESVSSVKRSVSRPSSCVSAIMRQLFEIYDIQSRILDWSGPSDEIIREIQYIFTHLAYFPTADIDTSIIPRRHIFDLEDPEESDVCGWLVLLLRHISSQSESFEFIEGGFVIGIRKYSLGDVSIVIKLHCDNMLKYFDVDTFMTISPDLLFIELSRSYSLESCRIA